MKTRFRIRCPAILICIVVLVLGTARVTKAGAIYDGEFALRLNAQIPEGVIFDTIVNLEDPEFEVGNANALADGIITDQADGVLGNFRALLFVNGDTDLPFGLSIARSSAQVGYRLFNLTDEDKQITLVGTATFELRTMIDDPRFDSAMAMAFLRVPLGGDNVIGFSQPISGTDHISQPGFDILARFTVPARADAMDVELDFSLSGFAQTVPEPSILAMSIIGGAFGLGYTSRRRASRRSQPDPL